MTVAYNRSFIIPREMGWWRSTYARHNSTSSGGSYLVFMIPSQPSLTVTRNSLSCQFPPEVKSLPFLLDRLKTRRKTFVHTLSYSKGLSSGVAPPDGSWCQSLVFPGGRDSWPSCAIEPYLESLENAADES